MSDADRDPFSGVFDRFRAEIDEEIYPYGVTATRAMVRSRARRRGAAVAIAVVIAVAAPIATYAGVSHHRAAQPAVTRPSPTASGQPTPSVSPRPSASISVRTMAQSFPGRLTYISRAGKNANQFNATLLTIAGTQIGSEYIGDPAWNQPPTAPDPLTWPPDTTAMGISPDGTRIAFLDNGNNPGLDITNTNGGDFRAVSNDDIFGCGSPIWSADGGHIVYTSGGAKTQITVLAADGSGRRVIGPGCYPVFTTSGQIAYVEGQAKLVVVNADGTGRRTVSPDIGIGRIRTIMSVSHGRAVIDVEQPSTCGCDDGTRRWSLSDPYVLDLATGALTRLPTKYGHVWSAFYGADGSLLLRTGSGGTKPATVVVLAPDGTVRATFDESVLSTPTAKVNLNLVDLVGYSS